MTKPASSLYLSKQFGPVPDLRFTLSTCIDKGCRQTANRPLVFFRADDIGIPSRQFQQLVECFRKHRLPLCLAAVPAWLTDQRLRALRGLTGTDSSQWCWHQHGRVHRNFEKTGKKQEFGPSRSKSDIQTSLIKGRERLKGFLGDDFLPVFTPPWNRCSEDTLQSLVHLDFKAVSRSKGALPDTPHKLPDFQINVDLHTRKEKLPQQAMANLLLEIEQGIGSGVCGIMIHHQRMNGVALDFLDALLEMIKSNRHLIPVHFGDLLDAK